MALSNKRSSGILESANLKKAKFGKPDARNRQFVHELLGKGDVDLGTQKLMNLPANDPTTANQSSSWIRKYTIPKLMEVSMKSDRYPFESLSGNRNYRHRFTGLPPIYETLDRRLPENQENERHKIRGRDHDIQIGSGSTWQRTRQPWSCHEPPFAAGSRGFPDGRPMKSDFREPFHCNGGPADSRTPVFWNNNRRLVDGRMRSDFHERSLPEAGLNGSRVSSYNRRRMFNQPMRPDFRKSFHPYGFKTSKSSHNQRAMDDKPSRSDFRAPVQPEGDNPRIDSQPTEPNKPVRPEPVETPAVAVAPAAQVSQLDVMELFQKLVKAGLIPNLTAEKKKLEEETKEPEIIPASFRKPVTLKIKNPAVIAALYSGKQCGECGDRSAIGTAEEIHFDDHLDWHFRQNRKIKDSASKTHSSRPWYHNKSDDLKDNTAEKQQPSVPTGSDDDGFCDVCREPFDQFFNQEKEEWHLRLAVSSEGKTYHPLCLEDHKKKSALEKSYLMALEDSEEVVEGNKENDEEPKKDLEDVDIYQELLPYESTIVEAGAIDTTQVAVKSSIDGNVESDSAVSTISAASSKIKLYMNKVLVAPKETDQSNKDEKITPADEIPVEVTPAEPTLIPAAIKPSLQGKKLAVIPTVERDGELSGLCSIA